MLWACLAGMACGSSVNPAVKLLLHGLACTERPIVVRVDLRGPTSEVTWPSSGPDGETSLVVVLPSGASGCVALTVSACGAQRTVTAQLDGSQTPTVDVSFGSPAPAVPPSCANEEPDAGTLQGPDAGVAPAVDAAGGGEGRDGGVVTPTAAALLVAGDEFTCAAPPPLARVHCWGNDDEGQLSHPSSIVAPQPVRTGAGGTLDGALGLLAGHRHACAWLEGHQLWCWGRNVEGQVGDGSTSSLSNAVPIEREGPVAFHLSVVTGLGGGNDTSCAMGSAGHLLCWGRTAGGSTTSTPTSAVADLGDAASAGVTSVTLSAEATCFVSESVLHCAGLGLTGFVNGEVAEAALGDGFACVRRTDGRVHCWGSNTNGETGRNQTISPLYYNDEDTTIEDAVDLCAGPHHACAATGAGRVACWGQSDYGQAGNLTLLLSPQNVQDLDNQPLADIDSVACGEWHSCAMDSAGRVFCWGRNDSSQLGVPAATVMSVQAIEVPFP